MDEAATDPMNSDMAVGGGGESKQPGKGGKRELNRGEQAEGMGWEGVSGGGREGGRESELE